MTSRGLAGVLGPVAIAVFLSVAPSASALTEVSVKGAAGGGGIYAGKAECPSGMQAVSGGFTTSVGGYATINKATGDGWRVQALDTSSLTVYAFCSRRLDPSRASKSVSFPPNSFGVERTAKAACKRGRAVAGGWAFSPAGGAADNQPVFKSRPRGDDKWSVTAFNDSGGEARDRIKAFAYCLRGPRRIVTGRAPIAAGGNGDPDATCLPGTQLLGGGFTTSPKSDFDNETGPDLFYAASTRTDPTEWSVFAHNYSDVGGTTTAIAVCRP